MNYPVQELISLALTFPTCSLNLLVVVLFYRSAIAAFFVRHKKAAGWVSMGICIGFIGSTVDNTYWAIPWTSSFLGSEHTAELVNFGVHPNIFFRQICGILSSYCHARSVLGFVEIESGLTTKRARNNLRFLNQFTAWSFLTGFLYAFLLIVLAEVKK